MASQSTNSPDYDKLSYKRDILNRMGGKALFELAMFDLCDLISNDKKLSSTFHQLDKKTLLRLQLHVFYTAMAELPKESPNAGDIVAALYNSLLLFHQGFDDTHFVLILDLFVDVMESMLLEQDVIHDVVDMIASCQGAIARARNDVKQEFDKKHNNKRSRENSSSPKKSKGRGLFHLHRNHSGGTFFAGWGRRHKHLEPNRTDSSRQIEVCTE